MAGMEFKSSEFAKQPPLFWKLKWAAGQGMWRMHPHDRTVDPARLSQADTDDIGEEAKKGASYIYIVLISKESKDLMISHTFQWLGVQVIPSVSTIFSCRSSACCPCCSCWSVIPGYWHCD